MHVIIGILGGLVTIMYLLDRLGIDIGWWNPFHLYRRRSFAKKLSSDPIYSIEDPIHIASLLIIGAAKLGGELTAEQKRVAQQQFESSFSLSPSDASGLFGSAAHLLAAPQLVEDQLGKLADKNSTTFSNEQATSIIEMMSVVIAADGEPSPEQRGFLEKMRTTLAPQPQPAGTWS